MKLLKFKKFYQLIMNLKIAHKLLLSYFILILIPLSLISFLFYQNFSNFVKENITYYTKQSFEQTYSFLSYKLNNIKGISEVPIKNSEIVNILKGDINSKNLMQQMQSMNKLLQILSPLEDDSNIARVRLYVHSDFIYSNDNRNILSINSIKGTKWYNMFTKKNKAYIWAPSSYLGPDDPKTKFLATQLYNKDLLSLTRLILDPANYKKSIAAVRFDFYKNDIIKILNKANTLHNSFSYIVNSDGEVIATSSTKLLEKYRVKSDYFHNSNNDITNWNTYDFSKEEALVGFHALENTDWRMVTVIPYGDINSVSQSILSKLLLLTMIIISCAFLLAYIIAYSITNGISGLSHKMRNLHNGKLEPIATSSRKDEIGMLIEDYNYMADRITELT
jgi:two-component system, sensor histidine kinase YesM